MSDVSRLFEEYTRYHFYLQLRKDILAGRLSADDSTLAQLASYVLQCECFFVILLFSNISTYMFWFYIITAELGDFCEEDHKPGYAAQFRYIPGQNGQFEAKVESLHRLHQGQTPADAEVNYLDLAKNIELYGVDLHSAKVLHNFHLFISFLNFALLTTIQDCDNQDIQVGVSANGLLIFKQAIKVNTFSWAKIVKISFKRRFFFVQTKHEGVSDCVYLVCV